VRLREAFESFLKQDVKKIMESEKLLISDEDGNDTEKKGAGE
jgi:hypothetical protein